MYLALILLYVVIRIAWEAWREYRAATAVDRYTRYIQKREMELREMGFPFNDGGNGSESHDNNVVVGHVNDYDDDDDDWDEDFDDDFDEDWEDEDDDYDEDDEDDYEYIEYRSRRK